MVAVEFGRRELRSRADEGKIRPLNGDGWFFEPREKTRSGLATLVPKVCAEEGKHSVLYWVENKRRKNVVGTRLNPPSSSGEGIRHCYCRAFRSERGELSSKEPSGLLKGEATPASGQRS